jgi:hypothetical protein
VTQNRVWWWDAKGDWCTQLAGRRYLLAKGKGKAAKRAAQEQLSALLAERALLRGVNGQITVARLCEEFLEDTQEHLARKTYESYQYACQKLVDHLGAQPAHAVEPLDIERFSRALKTTLNPT